MTRINIELVKNNHDLKDHLEIRNTVFTQEKGVPIAIEVDEQDTLTSTCQHFLVIYQDKKIGAFRCLIQDNTIILQRLCLLRDYRNLGLGTEILQAVETYYTQKQKTEIQLDAKYHLLKFYQKNGYQAISDVFIEVGIEHIKMKKTIKNTRRNIND